MARVGARDPAWALPEVVRISGDIGNRLAKGRRHFPATRSNMVMPGEEINRFVGLADPGRGAMTELRAVLPASRARPTVHAWAVA